MTNTKTNIPQFEEQQFLNEEQLKIQQILVQFKQLVPINFVQLETKERNYMCSTQGWKEPVCERYMFSAQGQALQIDIPQELMTELGLAEVKDKDKNIYHPVYLSPEVLKRKPIQLGITIKKEEIFIQRPFTINNLEQELKNWLTELKNSREQINRLINTDQLSQDLAQENQLLKIELQGEKQLGQVQKETNQTKINALKREKEELESRIDKKDREINQLTTERDSLERKKEGLENEKEQLNNHLLDKQNETDRLKTELDREQGWWDKWINDETNIDMMSKTQTIDKEFLISRDLMWEITSSPYKIWPSLKLQFDSASVHTENKRFVLSMPYLPPSRQNLVENVKSSKKLLKYVYEYYKNR